MSYGHSFDCRPPAATAQTPNLLVNVDQAKAALVREQSKFLGGDVDHTHLVKGLDFSLLRKVRSGIGSVDREARM
jgi:hypothetical protein